MYSPTEQETTTKKILLGAQMKSSASQSSRRSPIPLLPDACGGSIFEIVRQSDTSTTDNIFSTMDNYKMSLKIAGQGNYQDPCREQELRRWILLVPLTDAQLTKQRPLDRIQGLAWNRIQVIESAFYVASHLSQSIGRSGSPLNVGGYGEEQPEIPSIEFLSWMLNGTMVYSPLESLIPWNTDLVS